MKTPQEWAEAWHEGHMTIPTFAKSVRDELKAEFRRRVNLLYQPDETSQTISHDFLLNLIDTIDQPQEAEEKLFVVGQLVKLDNDGGVVSLFERDLRASFRMQPITDADIYKDEEGRWIVK